MGKECRDPVEAKGNKQTFQERVKGKVHIRIFTSHLRVSECSCPDLGSGRDLSPIPPPCTLQV